MQPGERGGVVGGGPGAPGPGVVSGPQGQHRVPQVVGGVPPGGGGEGVVVGGPKTNALARLNRNPALPRKALRLMFSAGTAGKVTISDLAVRYTPKAEVKR